MLLALGLALTGVAGQPGVVNMLPNNDLSEGLLFPKGWTAQGGGGGRVDWVASADRALWAVRLSKTDADDWVGLGISRPLPCKGGETVSVGAWIRSSGVSLAQTRLHVRFFDSAGRFIGQEGPAIPAGAREWTWVSGVVTSPALAARMDVSLQVWDIGAAVEVTGLAVALGAPVDELRGDRPGQVELTVVGSKAAALPDADGDGLTDAAEAVLGTDAHVPDKLARAGRRPSISFQTPTGYLAENDVKADVVIVADNAEDRIRSWAAMGYEPHVMVGFRAGDDYVKEHPDEVQAAADGSPLTCGPGSYYMVPTENRRTIFERYFFDAITRGAKAACPEEPEFFSQAGYSGSFKRIYQDEYGRPWEDPASSVDARYRADRLKGRLEHKLLDACWDGARRADPNARLFLLAHSPVNYSAWGIVCPHWDILSSGRVQSLVGQVWTGTARSAVTLRGSTAERTFENAYLEYASLVGLARDTGVDLWFLMDPLEDNPDRTMADYIGNYARTLCASLFFPEVDRFEVMPWPTRIFGHVPDEYATTICTVVNALGDIQDHPDWKLDPDRAPIATFIADSLQLQRGAPARSSMDSFYGLCLPFVGDGVLVQVAQLERAADPSYLSPYKTLLLSYDAMKPLDPAIDDGIAEWVRAGGELLVLGGTDSYNALDEWWTRAGYPSPQDHLFQRLGTDVGRRVAAQGIDLDRDFEVIAKTDYIGHDLENQAPIELDLTRFARAASEVLLRFEDSIPADGWGAFVTRVTIDATRDGRPVRYDFAPGTPDEESYVMVPGGASAAPGSRFADGSSFFVYRFPVDRGCEVRAHVTVGNQYIISACGIETAERSYRGPLLADPVTVPISAAVTAYEAPGLDALRDVDGNALVFRTKVGAGTVTFCGLQPGVFCSSRDWDDLLPRLLLEAPKISPSLSSRRGPYLSVRGLENGGYSAEGLYVDLLDARLPVVTTVTLGPDTCGFYKDWTAIRDRGEPALIASSAHVEYRAEAAGSTRLLLQGPEGTGGAARLYCAGRRASVAEAIFTDGKTAPVSIEEDGDTALLRFACDPLGVAVRVAYE